MPRWPSWLAVVAVLVNVLAGVPVHAPAQGASSLVDTFAAHLMCTVDASGTQRQAPGGGQEPDGKSPHCSLCTLLAGFALPVGLSVAAIAFPRFFVFHPPLRFDLGTLARHLSLGGIRSRAPPLPA
jgi:hypothetical protein